MAEKQMITEAELNAYVDEQLDEFSRLEVADYLARNPEVAARVLADIRTRDALRLMAGRQQRPAGRQLVDAAQRVDRALSMRDMRSRLGRVAAALALLAVGMSVGVSVDHHSLRFAQPARAAMPTYLEEALMSHRTALVRRHMRSQPEINRFDPQDVRSATNIDVPELPSGWRILDVQLFPSDYGPSLQMFIDAGKGTPVSLFAARADIDLSTRPMVSRYGADGVAYWARDGVVYVLTGAIPSDFLRDAATDLSDNKSA